MHPLARQLTRQIASIAALICSVPLCEVAQAQAQTQPLAEAPPTPPPTLTLTPTVPAQPVPPAPNQDRVMQATTADEADAENQRPYDNAGLPRGYSLEAQTDLRQSQGIVTRSLGLKASGYMDTLHYGGLSGNVTWQGDGAGTGQPVSYILRQMGMPFEGGWRADNALGMTNLPTLDLARKSPRITLTGPTMLGLTSHWVRNGDLGVLLGAGKPGQFSGFPVARFDIASGGNYALLGVHDQRRNARGLWAWGGMLAQANNVPSVLSFSAEGMGTLNAQGTYLTGRHEWPGSDAADGGGFVQVNLLAGGNTGINFDGLANPRANGLWLDGGFSQGPVLHSWGLFRLDPQLAWLDLPTANDLQGGYWRLSRRTRQWSMETSLDLLSSVSGTTSNGYFASQSLRYQYSSSTSFGGSANLRRFGGNSQALLLYSQFVNPLGSSRAQAEWANADSGDRLTRFQFDHDWSFVQALRLSTSVSLDTERKQGVESQGRGVAINGYWLLGQNLSATHSLQGRWSTEQTQFTLNTGVTWRFAPQWSLQANIFAIQGQVNPLVLAQSPLTPVVPITQALNDSGVFMTVRYDFNAGRATAPLGGAPGTAAGRLEGSVYLDDNQSGKREASERGAANVTVVLDGRFSVQTDAQGRFEFAYVKSGAHVLTVISDNLPLPWGLVKDGRTEVRVVTRDTTVVDIGAQKQ